MTKKDKSKSTTVILPPYLKDNEKLNRAISWGFESRSRLIQKTLVALDYLIETMGLEKGIFEMQKRLEMKDKRSKEIKTNDTTKSNR
jgi:hypothetical protein